MTPRVIVGLGNPGKEYACTRHNVGFMVLDALSKNLSVKFSNSDEFSSLLTRKNLNGKLVYLLKPLTFVNLSGIALKKFVAKHNILFDEILVVCDDFSLPFGKLRLRLKGSSGGHKGLQSIIDSLGSELFGRLRVGLGFLPEGVSPEEFVLSEFTRVEKLKLQEIIDFAALSIEKIFEIGSIKAMELINTADLWK